MRTPINADCGWVCGACKHHNPAWRMACRRCRTPRPLGS
ncbi:zinc finger protein [Streptomyces sp. NPDC088817]